VEGTASVGIFFRENCNDKRIIIIITSQCIEEEKYGDLRPGCGL
jgi:hypothetical protein